MSPLDSGFYQTRGSIGFDVDCLVLALAPPFLCLSLLIDPSCSDRGLKLCLYLACLDVSPDDGHRGGGRAHVRKARYGCICELREFSEQMHIPTKGRKNQSIIARNTRIKVGFRKSPYQSRMIDDHYSKRCCDRKDLRGTLCPVISARPEPAARLP